MARLLKVGATGFPTESVIDDANGIGIPVQSATPSVNPAVGYVNFYSKPDGSIYMLDSNGKEVPINPMAFLDMVNSNLGYIRALATKLLDIGIKEIAEDENLVNLIFNDDVFIVSDWGKKAVSQTTQTLVDAPTIVWDMLKGYNAKVTIGGNRALSIINAVDGDYGKLRVKQDLTGSRLMTLPTGSIVISGGAGAVTLSTTAGAVDTLSFDYDGISFGWTIGKNYT